MQTDSDAKLLRQYEDGHSEAAFEALVQRHVHLVYSAALRQVDSPPVAADIAQRVFVALAQNARPLTRRIAPEASLAGWLCRSARNLSLNHRRDEGRRQAREREAMEHLSHTAETPIDWEKLGTVLDQAMSELGDVDYDAVVMRFYENRDFRQIGAALGTSDDTAQKRVSRALERLRCSLLRQGLSTTAGALAISLSANAVQTTPAAFVTTIVSSAVAAGAAAAGAGVTTQIIAMTTLQKTVAASVFAALAALGIQQFRVNSGLRRDLEQLRQPSPASVVSVQVAEHPPGNGSIPTPPIPTSTSSDSEHLRELLRLRNQVATLQRKVRELESRHANPATRPGEAPVNSASNPSSANPSKPLLQLQLVLDEASEDSETVVDEAGSRQSVHVKKAPLLDQSAIRSATTVIDPLSSKTVVEIEFTEAGRELFAAVTRENLNRRLAFIANGRLHTAPVIRSEITGGKVQITGSFSDEEARALAEQLNHAAQLNHP